MLFINNIKLGGVLIKEKGIVVLLAWTLITSSFVTILKTERVRAEDTLDSQISDEWWNTNWSFRKKITIDGAIEDYQMELTIWKENGYDNISKGSIDCEDNCNDDFSDLRFVDEYNNEIPYWIAMTGISDDDHYTTVWINTTGSNSICMYYGNTNATSNSNGSDVWFWYDDFNDGVISGWSYDYSRNNQGGVTESGGLMNIWANGNSIIGWRYAKLYRQTSFPIGTKLIGRISANYDWRDSWYTRFGFGEGNNFGNSYGAFIHHSDSAQQWYCVNSGITSSFYSGSVASLTKLEIHRINSLTCMFRAEGQSDDYISSNIPIQDCRVFASTRDCAGANAMHIYLDYIAVGKTSEVEPLWISFGIEEINPDNLHTNELIVKFRDEVEVRLSSANGVLITGISSIDQLNIEYISSAEKLLRINSVAAFENVYLLMVNEDSDVTTLIDEYNKIPEIEYAEPNHVYSTCYVPNDRKYSYQWASGKIQAPQAWDIEKGNSDIIIAVIDTGVDYTHPDLEDNIWINNFEIPDNNIDDDGNGYVDDIIGWDFVNKDNDPLDDHGHGTHCSGIASAVTNNKVGIAGVTWNCKIMNVKSFNRYGGAIESDIIKAIIYAADNGADIISMSFGSRDKSSALYDALKYAYSTGVVLVGAAGNDDSDIEFYPAARDEVIAVAATLITDEWYVWVSNYGYWVDVAAPGHRIYSTMPTYQVYLTGLGYSKNYDYMSGTSMACPHVSGLSALILSNNSDFSVEEVRTIILSTTDPINRESFKNQYLGTGRINAYKAILRDKTPIAWLDKSVGKKAVNGIIDIYGTAEGINFEQYQLFYGVGIDPTNWILILNSSSPIINDKLGSWDTYMADSGYATIKLIANGSNGEIGEDRLLLSVDHSINLPPNLPYGPSPPDSAIGVDININLKWNCSDPEEDPLTYDIYFDVTNPPQKVVSNYNYMIWDPGSLEVETTYYWQIVAFDDHDQSSKAPIWSFTTFILPNNPPVTPININPNDDETGVDLYTNLSWICSDPDGDSLTFDVYFGDSSFPPLISFGQSEIIIDPGTLLLDTTYYWKIIAKDNRGAITIGPIWSFTTKNNHPPNVPSNPIPSNNSIDINVGLSLSWIGEDPDEWDLVTYYDIFLGTSNPPQKVEDKISINNYSPGALTHETIYYWQIISFDAQGASTIGPLWIFTTKKWTGYDEVYIDDDYDNKTPGWKTTHYDNIQDGINNVSDGGTVDVYNGIYYENIVINKPIKIIGEDNVKTIIDGDGVGDVVTIISDTTSIKNITVKNSGYYAGIKILSNMNTIENIVFSDNYYGVWIDSSLNNSILNSVFSNNKGGIRLRQAHDTIITGNSLLSNSWEGITLESSERATITDNTFNNNGITISGPLNAWTTHIIENNVANNKKIYYYKSTSGITVPSDAIQVIIADCTNTNIEDLTISNIEIGILLGYSSEIMIQTNNFDSISQSAIYLYNSDNNYIIENSITNGNGIDFWESSYNIIQHNTIDSTKLAINMYSSEFNKFIENQIIENSFGIWIHNYCNDNIFNKNIISSNSHGGIWLMAGCNANNFVNNTIKHNGEKSPFKSNIYVGSGCSGNTFYKNNFISNYVNAYDMGNNIWDDGYPAGGNYWSDYNGEDQDGDGIGDQPYDISGGSSQDRYPYTELSGWEPPPYEPSNPQPEDNALNVPLNSYLTWTGGDPNPSDSVMYDVFFGTNSSPPKVSSDQISNQYYPILDYNTVYYWKIVSLDSFGHSTEGPTWNFRTIGGPPIVNFNWSPSYPKKNEEVNFIDKSIERGRTIVNWHWDFGDRTTSEQQHPAHQYTNAGYHDVILTVTDDQGDTTSKMKELYVEVIPPKAEFTWTSQNLIVFFTDTSSDPDGKITKWSWDFGDGTTSNIQNPSHNYQKTGIYTVTLTVYDQDNVGDTYTTSIWVASEDENIIMLNPSDDARINQRRPSNNYGSGENLDIRNMYGGTSSGWAYNVLIKFDISSLPDNAKVSSASLNLYYSDNFDSDAKGRSIKIFRANSNWNEDTITWNYQPSYASALTASAITPPNPRVWMTWDVKEDIQNFINGQTTNYGWKITDNNYWGRTNIPILRFKSKEFSDSQLIPYMLIIYTEEKEIIPPKADFTFSPVNPRINDIIQFTDKSTAASEKTIISWYWDFGDSYTSSQQNPSHQYVQAGSYTTRLLVTDSEGEVDDILKTIAVSGNNPPVAQFSYIPQNPRIGDIISFIDKSQDSDGAIDSWYWNFRDGTSSTQQNPTYQYQSPGYYYVELTVTDNEGKQDKADKLVIVASNNPPNADAGKSCIARPNQQINFDGSRSHDSDGNIVGYRWDYTNDGIYDTEWLTIPTTEYSYSSVGNYIVKLQVKDNDGATDKDTTTVTICLNNPPIANAGNSYTDHVNATIKFDGSKSSDSDGQITGYRWDFENDGDYDTEWLTKSTAYHVYTEIGYYVIKLQVIDNEGATDTGIAYASITINTPPSVNIYAPSSGHVSKSIKFNGYGSIDPDGYIVGYRWDFENDGVYDTEWTSKSTAYHAYPEIGLYIVKLQVKDNEGATNTGTASIQITVNQPPVAKIEGKTSGDITETFTFNGGKSSDSDGYITSYRWDYNNDGTYDTAWSSSSFTSYKFDKIGVNTIKLQVKDDDDATSTATLQVEVTLNLKPEAKFSFSPIKPAPHDTVQFTDLSTDSDGEISAWYWNFGDGITSYNQNPTHRYSASGKYSVTLTVWDNKDSTEQTTKNIEIISDLIYSENFEKEIGQQYFAYSSDNTYGRSKLSNVNSLSGEHSWRMDTRRCGSSILNELILHIKINNATYLDLNFYTIEYSDEKNNIIDSFVGHYNGDGISVSNDGNNWVKLWQYPSTVYSWTKFGPFDLGEKIALDDDIYIKFQQYDNCNIPIDGILWEDITLHSDGEIENIAPTSSFTYSPKQPEINQNIQFTDESFDPDGTITKWYWSFGDEQISKERNPIHQYVLPGFYEVILIVKDNDHSTNLSCLTIAVSENIPPYANASGPYVGCIDHEIEFDGFKSYDTDGYIAGYRWDFDSDGIYDTNWLTSSKYKFTYNSLDSFNVTLEVKDNKGLRDTDIALVTVLPNTPPIAKAGDSYNGWINIKVNFDGSNSSDSDGFIAGWRWDIDSDGIYESGWYSTPIYSYAYNNPGTYQVTLQVKDNDGATSTDSTFAYIVTNENPVANAGGSHTAMINDVVEFDASNSYDPDGSIIGYRWDFNGDNVYDTQWSSSYFATNTYSSADLYIVKLQVKDNLGATSTNSTTVRIIDENLNGQWHFDEKDGLIVYDSSGNNFNGIIFDATRTTNGKLKNALIFDGVNDYVKIEGITSISNHFTISLWVKFDSIEGNQALISRQDGIGTGREIILLKNGKITTMIGGETGIVSDFTPIPNEWHHIVISYFESFIKIYVDGNIKVEGTATEEVATGDIIFGIDKEYNLPFIGTLDEITIWNKVLSELEIDNLYNIPNQPVFEFPTNESQWIDPNIGYLSCLVSQPYTFTPPELQQIQIGEITYDRVTQQGCEYSGESGEPALPTKGAYILLPQNVDIKSIKVKTSDIISLGNGYLVEPIAMPALMTGETEYSLPIPDETIYGSDDPYPGELFSVTGQYSYRGYDVLVLTLYPVQYVPESGELFYYDNMFISIETEENENINQLYRNLEADKLSVMDIIDNPGVTDMYNSVGGVTSASYSIYDMVIITKDEFKSGFEPLQEAHSSRGLKTTIKTVEDIYANYQGVDNTEKVRNFIIDAYNDWGIEYVLLGGDIDIVPARKLYVYAYGYTRNMPSDMYYGCLDGTFNYDGDSNWGERNDGPNGGDVDLLAEVYVGRACVGNINEVNNFVDKTLTYINNENDYLKEVLLAGELLWSDPTWGADYMNELIDGASTHGYTTIGFPSDEYNIETMYDKNKRWSKSTMINRINQDTLHIINHLGHANYNYNMRMFTSDVSSLNNENLLFIYSQGCNSGGFDQSSDCIAEYFTAKRSNGAYAGIWNARYGWGRHWSTDGDSQHYNREFWDAVFGEGITKISKANQDSKEDNIYRINRGAMRWCAYGLNLFGDPALDFLGDHGEDSGDEEPDSYMDVNFYYADGTLIGTDPEVANNSIASVEIDPLPRYRNISWYVTINDGFNEVFGPIWWFTVEAYDWDINRDGRVDNIDSERLISHYGESGEPGWIREDVIRDGMINIKDVSTLANHYGESYILEFEKGDNYLIITSVKLNGIKWSELEVIGNVIVDNQGPGVAVGDELINCEGTVILRYKPVDTISWTWIFEEVSPSETPPQGQEETPPSPQVYEYDINGDGEIDDEDLELVSDQYGETGEPGWIPADVNEDGLVDNSDLVNLIIEYQESNEEDEASPSQNNENYNEGGNVDPPFIPGPPIQPNNEEENSTADELDNEQTYLNQESNDNTEDFNENIVVKTSIRSIIIGGKTSSLVSIDDDFIPEYIRDEITDTYIPVTYAIGDINTIEHNKDEKIITVIVRVQDSGWNYIEIVDQYPEKNEFTVKTHDGRIISNDMIWRENGKIYVLDDSGEEYQFIYNNELLGELDITPESTKPIISLAPLTIIFAILSILIIGFAIINRRKKTWNHQMKKASDKIKEIDKFINDLERRHRF